MFPSILVSGRGVFRGFGPVDGQGRACTSQCGHPAEAILHGRINELTGRAYALLDRDILRDRRNLAS
jgi:hypothetical protein